MCKTGKIVVTRRAPVSFDGDFACKVPSTVPAAWISPTVTMTALLLAQGPSAS